MCTYVYMPPPLDLTMQYKMPYMHRASLPNQKECNYLHSGRLMALAQAMMDQAALKICIKLIILS